MTDARIRRIVALQHDGLGTRNVTLTLGREQLLPASTRGRNNVYRMQMYEPIRREVIVKKIWRTDNDDDGELDVLRQLRHVNIVNLLYSYVNAPTPTERIVCIILEYVPSDLQTMINERLLTLERNLVDIKLYTWQLFNALGYIHALGVTHLDVKPENILCDPIMHVIKLADFDSARRLSPQHGIGNRVYCVTRYYRPPELVFNGTVHTVNIDIWSAGCVLGQMLCSQPLLHGRNRFDQCRAIINALGWPTPDQCRSMGVTLKPIDKYAPIVERSIRQVCAARISFLIVLQLLPEATPNAAVDLLTTLLVYAPETRPAASNVCEHEFFDQLRNDPPPNFPPVYDDATQRSVIQ